MVCDIDVQDAPTIVADDEEAVEHTERNRWHGEGVHCRNRLPMVSKEGEPTFGRVRISRRLFHPTGDRSLGKIKTEHEELAMDTRGAPRWVLNDHPQDPLPNLLPRPASGDQPPVHTK